MDDAQCAAKAARVGQFIQPYAARCAAVAGWCDEQTPGSIAAFYAAHGLVLPPSSAQQDGGSHHPAPLPDAGHPYRGRYSLHELHDVFGPSVTDGSYTAITCSEETVAGCQLINDKRAAGGLRPLAVYVAAVVTNDRGKKLSSTDIRAALAAAGALPPLEGGGGGPPGRP
jgi:hypothetical protein